MNVLHILVDGSREDAARMIDTQSRRHRVEVMDFSGSDVAYPEVVDKIESHDCVISWQAAPDDTDATA